MSAFTPTQYTLEPQGRPDNLSAAVLHSLSRPIIGDTSPNLVLSFIFGALSFGIIPLISWPRRFIAVFSRRTASRINSLMSLMT